MLIFNIWIICGLISYYRAIYIDAFHKESNGETDKISVFIICMLGGMPFLLWSIWFDLQLLWIDIKYWISTLYDKVFKK